MARRTKIVTTLGPATDRGNNLEQIIVAGANMVRMNFSHGEAADHIKRAQQVRDIAAKLGKEVAIMGDLQGPKIRVSTFENNKIQLAVGDKFTLDSDVEKGQGNPFHKKLIRAMFYYWTMAVFNLKLNLLKATKYILLLPLVGPFQIIKASISKVAVYLLLH